MAQKRPQRHKKRRNKFRTFLVILLLIGLFIGGMYVAYSWFVGESKYINPTPSPQPLSTVDPASTQIPVSKSKSKSTIEPKSTSKAQSTTSPKETPMSSDKPLSTASISPRDKFTMKEYSNDKYGFSCPVISEFSEYAGEDENAVVSVRSADGSAYEHIFVNYSAPSDSTLSMREFISSYPTASILKNRSGDGYFYALIKYDDMYIYRYAAYTDGTEKGFEFGYNENSEALYKDCPEEIKDGFDLYD